MSLVITSNVDRDNSVNQQGINLPYSYTNSMDNLKIPPNSEIAVQSVKVNRDQSIALKGNQRFAIAFNKPIDSYTAQLGTSTEVVAFDPIQQSTDRIAFPVVEVLRNQNGELTGTYLPRELKTIFDESIKLATYPPMFKKGSLNTKGVEVSSAINSNGEVIFTYDVNCVLNASLANNASLLAGKAITTNIDVDNDELYTTTLTNSASGATLVVSNTTQDTANTATAQRPTLFTAQALSNVGGEWEIDLTKSIQGSNGNTDFQGKQAEQWAIGLTRPQLKRPFVDLDNLGVDVYYLSPPWYDEYVRSGQGTGLGPDSDIQYWDWVVKNEYNPTTAENEIHIYHSIADEDIANTLLLYDIDYVSGLGATKDDKFKVLDDTAGIDNKAIDTLKFKVSNEIMEITLSNKAGNHNWTISSNQYSGTNNGVAYSATLAKQMLKPVNQNCWNLYPKVMLAPFMLGPDPPPSAKGASGVSATNASAKNEITFDNYDGYTLNTPQGTTAIYDGIITSSERPEFYLPDSQLGSESDTLTDAYSDFCCYYLNTIYSRDNDEKEQSMLLDTNHISQFLGSEDTSEKIWNPAWKGLANDTLDVLPALLLEYSSEAQNQRGQRGYGRITNPLLNAQSIFGFNRPIIDNFTQTSGSGLRNFEIEADKTNRELPAVANFIRVKNLTHQTFNMANKSFSKILYCIPRFDNTGSDTGNLFFESNEKTYVKLNNTTTINVNSLDIDIVSADEKIAVNYVGQTVVIFHIRASKD